MLPEKNLLPNPPIRGTKVHENELVHHPGEEMAEQRQITRKAVRRSPSSRPVSRGMLPDLNQALGAQPAIACARLEVVSNKLKRLWSPFNI